MLLQSAAQIAKKQLVDDKITACVKKKVFLLGVICKVSTENHCLVKYFALLKKVFCQQLNFVL